MDLAAPRLRMRGDVRASDIALGLLTATLTLAAAAMAVVTMDPTPLMQRDPVLEPGELAVPVRASADPSPRGVATHSPAPRPHASAAEVGREPELGSATRNVAPRPPDAPPPVAAGELPARPIGGIKALPRLHQPAAPAIGDLSELPAPDEPGFGPGGPAVAPGEADPATSPDDPYAYVDPAREDPSVPAGTGIVGDEVPGADVLADRAVAAYRQRIQRWLSSRFVVIGSGLPRAELRGAKIRATLEIGDDRTVVGYAVEAGGDPALEAAAVRALESVRGQPIPEPPEHYPGPVQRTIHATFTCKESKCD